MQEQRSRTPEAESGRPPPLVLLGAYCESQKPPSPFAAYWHIHPQVPALRVGQVAGGAGVSLTWQVGREGTQPQPGRRRREFSAVSTSWAVGTPPLPAATGGAGLPSADLSRPGD